MLCASADTQKGRMFMIRVLVVEDQKIMQKYFEYILLQDTEFRHVQTVADADTAVKICQNSAIDLVLMDVQTYHNHDGLKAGKAIPVRVGHYLCSSPH